MPKDCQSLSHRQGVASHWPSIATACFICRQLSQGGFSGVSLLFASVSCWFPVKSPHVPLPLCVPPGSPQRGSWGRGVHAPRSGSSDSPHLSCPRGRARCRGARWQRASGAGLQGQGQGVPGQGQGLPGQGQGERERQGQGQGPSPASKSIEGARAAPQPQRRARGRQRAHGQRARRGRGGQGAGAREAAGARPRRHAVRWDPPLPLLL